eukprot:EC796773.1.p1 GENE.EC796773.1~~EC796773.1.p1  ORF type:complete len:214 (+),score=13.48 EC796773.1:44-685(+)
MVHITKAQKRAVYEYLFQEGVMVAKKDKSLTTQHADVPVPNLFVMLVMRSLVSKGHVKETFAWRHYYWFLTNQGIEALREYLGVPAEVIPNTLKAPVRQPRQYDGGRREGGRGGGFPRDREGAPWWLPWRPRGWCQAGRVQPGVPRPWWSSGGCWWLWRWPWWLQRPRTRRCCTPCVKRPTQCLFFSCCSPTHPRPHLSLSTPSSVCVCVCVT